MSITINRTDQYAEFNVSAPSNRGYITIDTSSWIDKPWMFYELPALKFEIYTESDGEVIKYKNFVREIRTYNPVYSPIGVLNVTIDIRNVPEEFTLRVIPIFDNDSISARNMLIENGIEDGEIWGKDQDIPTQSFDLDIEFIECTGEYIPPIPPTHEETVTFTEPPYTFDHSDGSHIISLTIKGNGQQNGTPSPQNILPFDGTGERTGNLLDYNVLFGDNPDRTSTYFIYYKIVLEPNTQYTMITNVPNFQIDECPYMFGTQNVMTAANDSVYPNEPKTITSNSDGSVFIACRIIPSSNPERYVKKQSFDNGTYYIMLNTGSTALPYEPYGYAVKLTCASKTTPLYLGEVSTVRRIKKLVFDGTEPWYEVTAGIHRLTIDGYMREDINIPFCTHYKGLSPVSEAAGVRDLCVAFLISASGNNYFYIHDSSYTTATTYKQYLAAQYAAGHPVTIWYVLATEQTGIVNEPLMKIGDYSDTLTTTTPIPTAKGSNELTVDTTVQPSEVSITYTAEG